MQCPHCATIFFGASAWSIEQGDELIDGILCPTCKEFISSEEEEELQVYRCPECDSDLSSMPIVLIDNLHGSICPHCLIFVPD